MHHLQEWNSLAVSQSFRKLFDQVLQRTKLIERELLLGGDERSVTNYVHLFELLNRKAIDRHLDLFELIQLLNSTGLVGKVGLKIMSDDFNNCTYCPLTGSIC